jgi:hypothetical protein
VAGNRIQPDMRGIYYLDMPVCNPSVENTVGRLFKEYENNAGFGRINNDRVGHMLCLLLCRFT